MNKSFNEICNHGQIGTDLINTDNEEGVEFFKADDSQYIYCRIMGNTHASRFYRYNAEGRNGHRIGLGEYNEQRDAALARLASGNTTLENDDLASAWDAVDGCIYDVTSDTLKDLGYSDGDRKFVMTILAGVPADVLRIADISGSEDMVECIKEIADRVIKDRNDMVSGGPLGGEEESEKENPTESPAPIVEPKKAKKTARKPKDVAHTQTTTTGQITLTAKQVDFIRHMPDTNFYENGLDSALWVDVLAEEIGGQFSGKPMTVGAMVSTLREKGILSLGSQKVERRTAKFIMFTPMGKEVAAALGISKAVSSERTKMKDTRTITMGALKATNIGTWSVKDDSPRGIHTAHTSEVKAGDKVVIDNYFTLVVA